MIRLIPRRCHRCFLTDQHRPGFVQITIATGMMLNFTARGSRQRAGFQQNDIMRGQSRTFRNIPPYRGQYLAFVGMVTILPPDLAGNDQLFPRPRIKTKSCDPVEQQAGMTGPGGLLNVSRRIIFATDDNQVLASAGNIKLSLKQKAQITGRQTTIC